MAKTSPPAPAPSRPQWYEYGKWLSGILLTIALGITLPVAAAQRLTTRETSIEILSLTLAGATSPEGLDSPKGIEPFQAIAAPADKTAAPRELRLKIFRQLAGNYYDQGKIDLTQLKNLAPAELADLQTEMAAELPDEVPAGTPQPETGQAQQPPDLGPLRLFTAETHQRINTYLPLLLAISALLLAALMFFARGFGRLAGPGLILAISGLPAVIFNFINSRAPGPGSRSDNIAETLMSHVVPLVVPQLASVYTPILVAGCGLLVLAAVGRLVFHPAAAPTPTVK